MLLERVPEGFLAVHDIAVVAALAVSLQVAGFDQIADDALCGALGQANLSRYVAQPTVAVPSEKEQHVSVICEERPRGHTLQSRTLDSHVATPALTFVYSESRHAIPF